MERDVVKQKVKSLSIYKTDLSSLPLVYSVEMIKSCFVLFVFVGLIIDGICSLNETCIPTSAGNSSIDDAPSIMEALANCGNGGRILIPENKIFTIRSPVDFGNCKDCEFQIEGTLKLSDDIEYWGGRIACFSIENVIGMRIHSMTGQGLIDGSGQRFWDYHAEHPTYQRPFFIVMKNVANITFTNFKLKDSPRWFITVNQSSIHVNLSNLILSAISTSKNVPINTDGIDIAHSSLITITNIHITNNDDCVCFKTGANNVFVKNVTCVRSRGLSVGSLGLTPEYTDRVWNIYASDIKMINSTPGIRIKVYPGGPTHGNVIVSNVTFERITIDNCDYAFRVQTCYETQEKICQQTPSSAQISNIKLISITGRTSHEFDPDVANINCPPNGTCDLTFSGWNVTSPTYNSTVLCSNYQHPQGVTCTPGAFG